MFTRNTTIEINRKKVHFRFATLEERTEFHRFIDYHFATAIIRFCDDVDANISTLDDAKEYMRKTFQNLMDDY